MSAPHPSDPAYRRDLGHGLVARWATAADADRLAPLYSHVFRDNADDPPNRRVVAWMRDMMSGRHPLLGASDFALVEDTARDTVVAGACLMAQTWEYGGIAFPVGRTEIVASHPDYRNRGLVRAVFQLIHARSDARGDLAQGITGIPYFYRQFGYEYAFDLGGSREVYLAAVPPLPPAATEPFALRDATIEDLPRLAELYDRARARVQLSTRVDARYWRYNHDGIDPASREGYRVQLIVDDAGSVAGYLLSGRGRWDANTYPVFALGLAPGVSLVAALPSVLRGLAAQAAALPSERPDAPPVKALRLVLGRNHPVYDALDARQAPPARQPYAWYVRVPDLPRLIRHLAPLLERRLADSILAGHSGELKLDFYRGGLRLAFERGRLTAAEDWRAGVWGPRAQGGFPPLVFLQLLFGHRDLAELCHAFPDVWASDEGRPLLESLFPPQPAWVLPLD